jgi:hypothetical protein
MIWDKLFWIWFSVVAALALMLILEEATTFNLLFASTVIGLGLLKLAGERARPGQVRIERKTLEKLKK